ncbi:hypothetical protein [Staphylococcus epidermidis]|uniref:hypothetical protein n=1 Tax=Staphylococcus epidermidis TaxID=1282 RepID=UPI001FFC763A|nr:hypothetical protein [Staphylococcus epidermidis]MCG1101512.1 hypothetical protein [Staphylococcus epidermidis]MCG2011156.1 hypothetical protein [Staphylococcus epidermidis]MCG2085487.1 hypothetical protein [Staphylococcus epidermidis]MCG2254753.1 hypothetical protein [Staphylococcus epidermidis]MCG2304787.1 hypothetical protein [Staphylococcus epidermidis]
MKKLILIMLGFLIILAGCGNKDTAPEKQKEITMTDIIKSSKKHVIFTGVESETDLWVDSIVITKNGKVKVYNLSTNPYKIELSKLANKSIDEIEKIGEKKQKDQGYPKAYYTTAHIWFDDEYPDEMQYEFRGFSKYISQYDDDKKEYELGKTEDEARKYMDRVQDFDEDSQYKGDYSFIGLPKSVKPTLHGYQEESQYLTNEIDNHLMSLDDGKIVANRYEDSFVATKVSDKTTLKKEKREDYKNDKIAGSYKLSNN